MLAVWMLKGYLQKGLQRSSQQRLSKVKSHISELMKEYCWGPCAFIEALIMFFLFYGMNPPHHVGPMFRF